MSSICILEKWGGYCNQMWNIAGSYLNAKKENKMFYIDDSNWIFTNNQGWTDYFNSVKTINCTDSNVEQPIEIYNSRNGNLKNVKIYSLNDYRNILNEIMHLNDYMKLKLQETMNTLNIQGNNFDAIMIRRGGKIFEEGNYINTEIYVNKLLEKNTKTIFVQTDDYDAYEEVKYIINKKNINIDVLTLCPEYKRGGTTVYTAEFNYMKSNIHKNNSDYILNFSQKCKPEDQYTKNEMKIHMEEMVIGLEICLLSRYLSTDFQSNITRMLYTRHNNPNNVINVLNTLIPDFNKKICNPMWAFTYA